MKDSAIVYRNFMSAVKKLPAEKQGEAYEAYMLYALDGLEYSGSDYGIAALLESFKLFVDEDRSKYAAKCKRTEKMNAEKSRDDIVTKSKRNSDDIVTKSSRNSDDIVSDNEDDDVDDIREKDANASKERAPRRRYGAYNHVLLTDDEYQKLFDSFGEPTRTELINKLDEYCQETGKTYKDYYLVIAKKDSWVQREVMKPKRPVNKAEKEARRGTERGTDYDAAVRGFAMNPPEGLALPFNDPNDANVLDALDALVAM